MKSIISRKGIAKLALGFFTILIVSSCSSSPSRDVADDHSSDTAKVQDGYYPPAKFHGNRVEQNNQR